MQCAIATSSPSNDLHAVWEMRQYRKIRPEVADACLKSTSEHLWHLTESLVVFSLADENLPNKEMVTTARPYTFSLGKPKFSDVMLEKFWPDNGECPSLSTLIGPGSWHFFVRMKMEEMQVEWLQLELSQFIRGITVVNDPTEHGVKDISVNEELRQLLVFGAAEHRKQFLGGSNAAKAIITK